MSTPMTLTVASALDATATGPSTPVRANVTPIFGGQGHNAFLLGGAAAGGDATIKVQGHDSPESVAPGDADSGWYDVATLDSAAASRIEVEAPAWVRANVTAAGTNTTTATIKLEGVQ